MTYRKPQSHTRLLSILIATFISLTIAVFYFGILPGHHKMDLSQVKVDGVFLPKPQEITNFHLTDNFGKPFTKDNLKGHWTLMFFGFTNCGDVCPTTMSELNKMYKVLQSQLPDNKLPYVVMISVDPDRDSVAKLNGYVTAFNPHFIGARGDNQEMTALEKQLHIVSARMQAIGQGKNHYTINHSAELIVFNPQAQLEAFLSYPHESTQMVKDYLTLLSTTNSN